MTELTKDELEGLDAAIERGIDDRSEYLTYGNPHVDYGDEWPEAARAEAQRWRACSAALVKLGSEIAGACIATAEALEASARECEELKRERAPDTDLCDTCGAIGKEISGTRDGKTICVECEGVQADVDSTS